MNAAASDLSGPLPGFGFGGVKPFAVGMGPTAVEKRCAKQREESEPMH